MAKSFSPRQYHFHHTNIISTTRLERYHVSSQGAVEAYPTWWWVNSASTSVLCKLWVYTPRWSKSLHPVWKMFLFLYKCTQCTSVFFSWQILKPRAWIQKGVESMMNFLFIYSARCWKPKDFIRFCSSRLNWKQALMKRRFRSITSIATLMTKKSLHFFLNATTTRWVTVHCYNNRAMRVKIWVKLLGAWWGIGKDSVNRIWALWISIVPSCALSQ